MGGSFSCDGIHFKERRSVWIGWKGDSQCRFSAEQPAKGCTKSWPDISRVYQSQCGSGVPVTATAKQRAEEKEENAGRGCSQVAHRLLTGCCFCHAGASKLMGAATSAVAANLFTDTTFILRGKKGRTWPSLAIARRLAAFYPAPFDTEGDRIQALVDRPTTSLHSSYLTCACKLSCFSTFCPPRKTTLNLEPLENPNRDGVPGSPGAACLTSGVLAGAELRAVI